jgi:hypothetical protein
MKNKKFAKLITSVALALTMCVSGVIAVNSFNKTNAAEATVSIAYSDYANQTLNATLSNGATFTYGTRDLRVSGTSQSIGKTEENNVVTTKQDTKTTQKTSSRANTNTNTLENSKIKIGVASASKIKSSSKSSAKTATKSKTEASYRKKTLTSALPNGNPRDNKNKRKIPDIDIPEKKKGKKRTTRRKRFTKRQIINPIPWLWDKGINPISLLPQKVSLIRVNEILQ